MMETTSDIEHTADTIWPDARARTVASWWHSFDKAPCPLYKLQSTGYIDGATAPHIESLIAEMQAGGNTNDAQDIGDLTHLLTYVRWHGHRQPVDGWHTLWDDEFENERADD